MTIKVNDRFVSPIPGKVLFVYGRRSCSSQIDVHFDGSKHSNMLDREWFEKTFTMEPDPLKVGDVVRYGGTGNNKSGVVLAVFTTTENGPEMVVMFENARRPEMRFTKDYVKVDQ